MKDIKGILDDIERQLDWKGTAGRGQGHIVLRREQAEVLAEWIHLELLRHEMEQPT